MLTAGTGRISARAQDPDETPVMRNDWLHAPGSEARCHNIGRRAASRAANGVCAPSWQDTPDTAFCRAGPGTRDSARSSTKLGQIMAKTSGKICGYAIISERVGFN